jgi:hypothetical protein
MKTIITAATLMGCLLAIASGCGPLVVPAFTRLDPKEQVMVDQMWRNMITDPNRLDRELLLDVLIYHGLFEAGIDEGSFHAVKHVDQATVLMDIKFVRDKPLKDHFDVTIKDANGKELRSEHYSGQEVMSHVNGLWGEPATRPGEREQTEEIAAKLQWQEARRRQIAAATQPASQPADPPASRPVFFLQLETPKTQESEKANDSK